MFSYHGHGTWMPDHPRGYVHRKYGLQEPDAHMAEHYRRNQVAEAICFDDAMQGLLIETGREAGAFIDAVVHACATEATHVHVLVSWKHDREWKSVRASVRSALTRALNGSFGKREWFSDSPSHKRVRDHEHLDYLVLEYLPAHHQCWVLEEDRVVAERRDGLREKSVRLRRKKKRS